MIKFARPFYPLILCAILLLFVQAASDLTLPNYMSDIVNVGIQQYGIEDAVPDAVPEGQLRLVSIFMPQDVREEFWSSYEKFEGDSTKDIKIAHGKLGVEYTQGAIYVLKKDADRAVLNEIFSRAATALAASYLEIMNPLGLSAMPDGLDIGSLSNITHVNVGTVSMEDGELVTTTATLDSDIKYWEDAGKQPELVTAKTGVMFTQGIYEQLGADLTAIQHAYIIRTGLIMLAIALLGGGTAILVGFLSSRVGSGLSRKLRNAFFQKVESFTSAEMDKFSTASLITRCTNDIMQIHTVFSMGIRMVFFSPIMAIGGVVMALNKSPSMSWVIVLAVVVLICLIASVLIIAMPKFQIIQTLIDKLNLVTREGLSGLMVIRAFNTQEHEKKRFDAANTDLAKTNLFVNRVMAFMMPVMMFIMHGVSVLVMWVGSKQIAASSLQVGDMMAFIQYLTQILMSFLMLSMLFFMIPRALVAMQRVNEVLNTESSIRDPESSGGFDKEKMGWVEFKNVAFRYEDAEADAVTDISFTASPGKTLAIIGSTGSGKSTLINLILRFFDVTAGQVLVNGADVREVTQKELRKTIGYVPQKGSLLSGTIASNIAYGAPDATVEEIEEAASIAQASAFIAEREDGLDSEISQGGTNVSGGQRQRLSIARALAAKPEIFIFDDSFSALDFKTDAALRRELNTRVSGATVIVVAQRVSTIMNADEILVMDEGRIVGRGTHGELLESCPQYHEIASSQIDRGETA